MLRVMMPGSSPTPPPDSADQPDLPQETPPEPDQDDQPNPLGGKFDAEKVSPEISGYMGPELGPFTCSNCSFFNTQDNASCHIVSGPIDPNGCCNLFTPHTPISQDEGPQTPTEVPQEPLTESPNVPV